MGTTLLNHLLVVDDDEMNRDVLSRRLQRLGYHVLVAKDGTEALELIRTQPVDLVLLDVMMPGIDGLEVLTTIRESHSLVELPVIMVTARDQSGDMVAALQLGANDYVTKPLNFPVVLARIQTQLAMRSAHLNAQSAVKPPATNAVAVNPNPPANEALTPFDLPTLKDKPVIGEYEVLHELGQGGMGIVYKARHIRMNRFVALKIIDKKHLANPDAVRRFYQEIQAAAQLSHPNVVIAYDAGQSGDTHYFAMEYVEGKDLGRIVAESGPLNIDEACDYIRQAALGLQHAHERGLVHRDIKPSNLLVTWKTKKSDRSSSFAVGRPKAPEKEAVVKILDLGLALLHQPTQNTTAASELTREGRVVGSVDYMAPEQWMNAHKVDIRADIYSLGCTFYTLLTGTVPFPGDEPMEKMLKHHLDKPVAVQQLRPSIPDKIAAVVERMMAKRPEDRYQTPGELAELLKWYCQTIRFHAESDQLG
ncbi:MAG: hypothetical protein KatS3mg105_2179 [Gemmatales bacterium]|nr:MAG: hypothetical protein KatS3mg105_2179 [Gemmatales bacterium]